MGANGSPALEGTPGSGDDRTGLAQRLDTIADELRAQYEDVSRGWPQGSDADVLIYWRGNIEIVKAAIDRVQDAADRSARAIGGPPEPEPLDNLRGGLLESRKMVHAALRAFEARDDAGQFEKQSDQYFKAVRRLCTLANFCQALATYFRGPKGL